MKWKSGIEYGIHIFDKNMGWEFGIEHRISIFNALKHSKDILFPIKGT